ncbi:KAP family P-loop NTPase fold protein [Ensifer adhaerens]|uniref:KAP family P-loop NTPase fold protein n=1 Tax=Ensifer adhaerens TaxID=106592 RepID=UPI001319C1E5|nr:P-loop NTPase fold protein [Ensifer adhaerens]
MTDIAEIWADDKLDRREKAEYLRAFLIGRVQERQKAGIKGAYVVNVEAEWGFGKTFFMERFFTQVSQDHPAVFINAWKSDFTDDPYTAVVSEIECYFSAATQSQKTDIGAFKATLGAVKKNAAKIFWMGLKGGLKRGARWAVGEAADEIVELVEKHAPEHAEAAATVAEGAEAQLTEVTDVIIDAFAEKRIMDFLEAKESLDNFRDSMSAMLKVYENTFDKTLPLFIFVDELDRCRPPYAIAMLERIKHLFDVDNVVFLISTDTKQLAHSINGVYGASFDSQRYLQRFFNRTYTLPSANNGQIINALLDVSGTREELWNVAGKTKEPRAFLALASNRMGMSIREVQMALDILMSTTTVWSSVCKIHLYVMYPLIFGYIKGVDIENLTESGWLWNEVKKFHDINVDVGGGETAAVTHYIHTLLNIIRRTVPTYMHEESQYHAREDRQPWVIWAHAQIRDEYDKIFANSSLNEKSIITQYGKMIKHAGFLTQT